MPSKHTKGLQNPKCFQWPLWLSPLHTNKLSKWAAQQGSSLDIVWRVPSTPPKVEKDSEGRMSPRSMNPVYPFNHITTGFFVSLSKSRWKWGHVHWDTGTKQFSCVTREQWVVIKKINTVHCREWSRGNNYYIKVKYLLYIYIHHAGYCWLGHCVYANNYFSDNFHFYLII